MFILILDLKEGEKVKLVDNTERILMGLVIDSIIQKNDSDLLEQLDKYVGENIDEIEDCEGVDVTQDQREQLWDEAYERLTRLKIGLTPHILPYLNHIPKDGWCAKIEDKGNMTIVTFADDEDMEHYPTAHFDDFDIPF